MTTTPKIGITYLEENQAGAEVTCNDAINLLETVSVGSIKSMSTQAQPVSPSNGDAYILPASPSGTNWAGVDDGKIAVYHSGWRFFTPPDGMMAYVEDTDKFVYYNSNAGAVDVANWKNSNADEVMQISGMIDGPLEKTYVIDFAAAVPYKVVSITHKCRAGGIDSMTMQCNGTNTTGITAVDSTSSPQTDTATGNNAVAAGQTMQLILNTLNATSPTDFQFTIKMTRN